MNTGFSGLRIAARRLLYGFILPGTLASAMSAAANTAPVIDPIPDIVLAPGSGTMVVPVEVEDAETPRASLQVQVTGSPYASTDLRADRWFVILGAGMSNAVLQVSVADPDGAVSSVGERVEALSPASLLRFSEIPPQQAWEGGPPHVFPSTSPTPPAPPCGSRSGSPTRAGAAARGPGSRCGDGVSRTGDRTGDDGRGRGRRWGPGPDGLGPCVGGQRRAADDTSIRGCVLERRRRAFHEGSADLSTWHDRWVLSPGPDGWVERDVPGDSPDRFWRAMLAS